ncbi:immunity 26/phosphotriesterase HocA family protein [Archangium lansingense]|uniref:Immunity 26/phosphotriesterase HocA family protein n=1 Tax=Archangium lansingense TaxID=2995310 RepID=A0ABT3ZZL6_9BACT|nr:immunity 26/phosphotriesterase HocA family protein [Archangium lansinium]MCY1074853.1 immunity 26/phosphotriesterase HocA family protein [Archangium lansinium]
MTKVRMHRPGTFLRIPLADGTFGYGRALEPPFDAFYEYRTESPDSDLDRIASKPILFKIAVRILEPSSWDVIGWREIEESLSQPIVQFRQDIGSFRRCTIFDTVGNSRSAEPQECVGLERMAVWEQHHVEERLLDTFMGRPNDSVEHLKVRLQ